MAITINGKVSCEGCVLSVESYYAHVPSDRAWIDSGHRLNVSYWVEEGQFVQNASLYTDDRQVSAEVDASPEIIAKAEEYKKAKSWFYDTSKACRHCEDIKVKSTVEVFKGRKIPKGIYTVEYIGDGNWGKYADLRDASGKLHRYINMNNLRVTDVKYPKYYEFFIKFEIGNAPRFCEQLAVFADKLEEDCNDMARFVRAMIHEHTYDADRIRC